MAEPTYRWLEPEPVEPARVDELSRALSLPAPLVRVLIRRDVAAPEEARRFLRPDLAQLHSPGTLPDVDAAARRIEAAVEGDEGILVHGDYDADGLSATALLTRALRETGARAEPFVPHRTRDGYGLGPAGLEAAGRMGATLIVTADCGTTARESVADAAREGIDVVVTDHHRPGPELPPAAAVVNPVREGAGVPFDGLSGVGVAYKLLARLRERTGEPPERLNHHLDLVALGTVADLVPLEGENRVLVRAGLAALERSRKPGIRSLLRRVGWDGEQSLDAGWISYRLAPRLNSAGRMGSARDALRLLLTDDPDEADRLASRLEEQNQRRRAEDRRVAREAEAQLQDRFDPDRDRGLVLWDEDWPPGVVGIAASRLVERLHRPTALVALEGETGRGSARSVEGFHLHRALAECDDLLERYGGHRGAAGFEIRRSRLEEFDRRFRDLAREALGDTRLEPELTIDLDLPLSRADRELHRWLSHLGPHGEGNPVPVLRSRGVAARALRRVGREEAHLKLQLESPEGARLEAIGFGLGHRKAELEEGGSWEVAYELSLNRWRGRERVQARVRDFRPSR